jgi:hypothetical protein
MAAKYSRTPGTDTLIEKQPVTPRTPVRECPLDPPITSPATRFFSAKNANRFIPLSKDI